MKIAIIADASSIHACRWANGLAEAGLEVHVVTQHAPNDKLDSRVVLHQYRNFGKIGYFTMAPKVRSLLKLIKPDIVNAHYASGYGTTARLVNYHPYLLSVWGSDVYDFPYKNIFNRYLLKKNLIAADKVASTSFCMAEQTLKLAPKLGEIAITPFGVDVENYSFAVNLKDKVEGEIVIGTVKTMAPIYGISTLIHAFAILRKKMLSDSFEIGQRLNLRLVGGGPQMEELKRLAVDLGIGDCTVFVGRVPHEQVPGELAKLDIFVALSQNESFGVAVIEAAAAGRPVVASNVGGLAEVTVAGETAILVPKNNPAAAANAIEKLILNPKIRIDMGVAGKKYVEEDYNWSFCVSKMISVYRSMIEDARI